MRGRRRQVTRSERGGLLRPDHHLAGLTDVWCRVSPTHGVFLVNCSQLSEDLNEQGDSMDLTIFGGIWVVACRVAPVEVNIVPASLLSLPHPRLLCLGGEGVTLFVQGLSNLDIADGGGIITQQVDHGTQNCDI